MVLFLFAIYEKIALILFFLGFIAFFALWLRNEFPPREPKVGAFENMDQEYSFRYEWVHSAYVKMLVCIHDPTGIFIAWEIDKKMNTYQIRREMIKVLKEEVAAQFPYGRYMQTVQNNWQNVKYHHDNGKESNREGLRRNYSLHPVDA